MSFWLARRGVFGLSTLKSALMRSQACRPNSRAQRIPRRWRLEAAAPHSTPLRAWLQARALEPAAR
jgi:hypothetical protein